MIKIGDRVPDALLTESTTFDEACPIAPGLVSVAEATAGKRVIIFGVPGAYTPTCSARHLPGYLDNLDAFKAKKVDEIWCVSANDGFVMAAWGRERKALGKIRMLGDGSTKFARKLGLAVNLSAAGLGTRIRRFSMLVEDGVIKRLNVEPNPKTFEVSDAETMLKQLG
jgi:peroxiredoxin